MKEDFLHFLWKYSLFNVPLKLIDGTQIEVLNAGMYNNDAGPDFFNAKIKMGNTIWAGNIEMHVKASNWLKHNHQNNKAYDSIILHVVADNDVEITRRNGEIIPTAAISCSPKVYEQYLYLMQNKNWVPCETFINRVNDFTIFEWKESLMIERLKAKAEIIERRWISNGKNFEETYYQSLAVNFGFKTNALPFEMLADQLPLKYILKHKDQQVDIESMLFGVAGFLPNSNSNAYAEELRKNYQHFQNKFNLKSLNQHLWKFSKLRPSNFPTIRLAQFASYLFQSEFALSKTLESQSFETVKSQFDIKASDYWTNHYVFGKESVKKEKRLGDNAFENIIINTVAPYYAFYAHVNNKPEYTDKAIDWLMKLNPEKNHITKHWSELGLDVKNAFDSQALIQLKNLYCNVRKCLNCRIGNQVIQYKF